MEIKKGGEIMIPFDFEYNKPDSLSDAIKMYKNFSLMNKEPLYYSGGTEIIIMARENKISTKAVIDIKGIPECTVFEVNNNKLIIGAAVTLTDVSESKFFSLLSDTARFPADHTARNKITTVGNICGNIIYKEAILGHLVADSSVIIYGENGNRILPINLAFNKKIQIEKGEFVSQLVVDMSYSQLPYVCVKKTKQGIGGYPLISMAALKKNGNIQMAFSGLCEFPFRSKSMEEAINNKSISKDKRIEKAIKHLPAPMLVDIQGSAEYRKFVLINILQDTLAILDGGER